MRREREARASRQHGQSRNRREGNPDTRQKMSKRGLNSCLRTCITYEVRGFKTILTLLALVIWLPCTARCELEKVRVLPTPSCCEDHSQSDKMPPDCGICESVSSGYLASESKITVPAAFIEPPPFAALSEALVETHQVSFPPEEHPPSILKIFQFTTRTALPVRAPSAS